jgi:beta-glucanase (GH16 family)
MAVAATSSTSLAAGDQLNAQCGGMSLSWSHADAASGKSSCRHVTTTTTQPPQATTTVAQTTTTTAPGAGGSCPVGQAPANDGTCVPIPAGTSKLVFDDEFSGNAVDSSQWDVLDVHGDRSNNEPECYLPANTSESNGSLNETVEAKNATCPIDSTNGGSGSLSSKYASGAVQMSGFNFTYGTVQFRAKFAGGSGPWPAVWLLGTNCQQPTYLTTQTCNWPNTGAQEVDLAEILQGDHVNVNEEVWLNGATPACQPTTTDVSQNWHVYGFAWSPSEVVFTIDGATTCTITSAVPSTPMFMIIDTAVGASGGSIVKSTLPQTTSIDYVRVFQ